jgi:hypothetical protein
MLLVSRVCLHARPAAELGIDLVVLPIGSSHLNPIEPLWKSLRWEISPIAVSSTTEVCSLVRGVFDQLTEKLRFASDWTDRFLNIRKLSYVLYGRKKPTTRPRAFRELLE